MIILTNSYPYTGNGLGGLPDAISCTVTHEVNGIYELAMEYPMTGTHYSDIAVNGILMAKPDNLTAAQPFRIYRITRPLNGVVTIYARHLVYDMSGIIIKPFSASTLQTALSTIGDYALPGMQGFSLASSRSVNSKIEISEPRSLWRMLGGQAGSFLDVYGGEWDFDGMTATLKTRLGTDRGVEIRYGKNLTELEADTDLSSTYGGVFPYWYSEDEGYVAPTSAVMISGSPFTRILLLDCSQDFEEKPTTTQLRNRATSYINANSVGEPKSSWKVNLAMLGQSSEYKGVLEQIMLGDVVKVHYDALGVDATARVVQTEYDPLKDQYINVTIGRVKQNLASIVVDQNRELEREIDNAKSDLEKAIDSSTDWIRNGGGYMRLIYDGDNLTEIVSMDNPDIDQATKVWRWNNGGFGYSSTGYNGTYGLALTQDGQIVADRITTGTLNAQRVKAGILSDTQNKNSWNLDTGAFTITSGSINITTSSASSDSIKLSYNEFESYMSPIGFSLKNSTTKRRFLLQAGVIYGYSDYTASTPVQDVYLSSTGALYLGGGANDGYVIIRDASGNANVSIYGSNGNATFSGNGSFGGTLRATGAATFGNTLSVTGAATLGSTLSVTGAATLGSTLDVTGAITGASLSVTGQVSGASASITGQITAGSVRGIYTSSGYGYVLQRGYLRVDGDTSGAAASLLADETGIYNQGLYVRDGGADTAYTYLRLKTDGLRFYNKAGTLLGEYPSTGLSVASLNDNVYEYYSSSGSESYTLDTGNYLVTALRHNSTTTTADSVWMVCIYSSGTSHVLPIISGSSTATVNGATLTISRGTTYMKVTITKLT